MAYELPSYRGLMLPTVRAVLELGGSGAAREITASVLESEAFSDEMLEVTYEGRDKSVLIDRLDWARSYCKLGGVLDSQTFPELRKYHRELSKEVKALRREDEALREEVESEVRKEFGIRAHLSKLNHPAGMVDIIAEKLGDRPATVEAVTEALKALGYDTSRAPGSKAVTQDLESTPVESSQASSAFSAE